MNSDNIMLSIMITFYNQVKYVDQTLKSVFSQKTNFNYEVLLGDDGSTDGSGEMCDEYNSDPHIQVIHQSLMKKYRLHLHHLDN